MEYDCAPADGGPSCWAAPPIERKEPAMELVLTVIGLPTTLLGASKALLELLRSGRGKEVPNKRKSKAAEKRGRWR